MEGCLLQVSGSTSLCAFDDFCKLAQVDLLELGIDLPEGVEGGEFSMFVQQDRQDPRCHPLNTSASRMSRHDIYEDVLLVTRGTTLSLAAWRIFVHSKFPRQLEQERKAEKRRKKAEACSVQ